jgi:hypothetical protein
MLPTASDLDDPDGFVHREQMDFSELDKMLGEAASGGGGLGDGPNLKKDDAKDATDDGNDSRGDGNDSGGDGTK